MRGIEKNNTNSLLHLLLGVFVQGEDFYNQQREEIREYFGDEEFLKAEGLLKETRLYQLMANEYEKDSY